MRPGLDPVGEMAGFESRDGEPAAAVPRGEMAGFASWAGSDPVGEMAGFGSSA